MISTGIRKLAATAFATLLASTLAHSAPTIGVGSGTITEALANPFAVSSGDGISLVVLYESDLLDGGQTFQNISLDAPGSGQDLVFNLGNRAFTASEDTDFGFGFPMASFENGNLTDLDFLVMDFAAGGFASLTLWANGNQFDVFDNVGGETIVSGTFNFPPLPPSPIPSVDASNSTVLMLLFAMVLGRRYLQFPKASDLPKARA